MHRTLDTYLSKLVYTVVIATAMWIQAGQPALW